MKTRFDIWWSDEGAALEHEGKCIEKIARIAWKNGAYCADPENRPVIYAREDCSACHGAGYVTSYDSVPYGSGNIQMPTENWCEACLAAAHEAGSLSDEDWENDNFELRRARTAHGA